VLGGGLLIGMAMASTGTAMAMAAASSAVSAQVRSLVLGCVSASGSLGAMIAAPLGQSIAGEWGWRMGLASFVILALIMLPAAWFGGRVDQGSRSTEHRKGGAERPAGADGRAAASAFVVMALASPCAACSWYS
jgi:predicted MFS family arabinose efflux permease